MKKPYNVSRFSKIMGAMVLVVLICFTASLQVYANTKMASKQSLSTKAETGQDTQPSSTQAPSTEVPSTELTKPVPTMNYDISDVVATNDLDNITGYIEAENFYDDKDLSIELSMGGKNFTVGLYNQFSQRLSYYKDKIYLSTAMKIGMTKKQAVQTAWGYPDEIDYIYRIETWTYKSSSDIFYVYFIDGVVYNTYRYYY